MRTFWTFVIMLVLAIPAMGQEIYLKQVDSDGTIRFVPAEVITTIKTKAGPIIPVDPVVPTDFTKTVKDALAAVPEYEKKDLHTRALSFSLNMISTSIQSSNKTPAENRETVKTFASTVTGTDADKWAGFWAALDPHLAGITTNANLADAYKTVQATLANAIPDSGDGDLTYGLKAIDPAFWKFLIEVLLPLLLKLFAL